MITKKMADAEIKTGLSAICSWCEHWHNAKGRGEEISCGVVECGGISSVRSFVKYKGPLENNLSSICFVCGGEPDAGVEINGRMLGVCTKQHLVNRPNKCIDILRNALDRNNIIAVERAVPIVGGSRE